MIYIRRSFFVGNSERFGFTNEINKLIIFKLTCTSPCIAYFLFYSIISGIIIDACALYRPLFVECVLHLLQNLIPLPIYLAFNPRATTIIHLEIPTVSERKREIERGRERERERES